MPIPLPPQVLARNPTPLERWPQVRLAWDCEPDIVSVGRGSLVLLDAQIQFVLTVTDKHEGGSFVLPDQQDRLVLGIDLEDFRALAQEVETLASDLQTE